MNILVVGCGAREAAIVSALSRSPQQPKIYCFGNAMNPGINQMSAHYRVGDYNNVDSVVNFALDKEIDMAIIGPESPLEKGLSDALWENNVSVIGPKKKLAQVETSKSFTRELMKKYHISGLPRYKTFKKIEGVKTFLEKLGEGNYVVKANGLMAGKGVKVAGDHLHSIKEALQFAEEIFSSHQTLLIEEKLIGQEFSLMCFCDGKTLVAMPVVQDHKRAYLDDKGPNTGGMGSYSDANHSLPFLTPDDVHHAMQINEAVLQALTKEIKEKYIGILYGSFIATKDGVHVIEFNARFGDPEALNVLTILESDFVSVCEAMVDGDLSKNMVKFARRATVCKYAVPKGYPDAPIRNETIDICAVKNKAQLYLASVNSIDGKIVATGSRTAAYVGVADTIFLAEKLAENEVRAIVGPLFHREDIGTEKLIGKRMQMMRDLRK